MKLLCEVCLLSPNFSYYTTTRDKGNSFLLLLCKFHEKNLRVIHPAGGDRWTTPMVCLR